MRLSACTRDKDEIQIPDSASDLRKSQEARIGRNRERMNFLIYDKRAIGLRYILVYCYKKKALAVHDRKATKVNIEAPYVFKLIVCYFFLPLVFSMASFIFS